MVEKRFVQLDCVPNWVIWHFFASRSNSYACCVFTRRCDSRREVAAVERVLLFNADNVWRVM